MKKHVLVLAAIFSLASLTTTAQKNSKILSGTVSYTKTKDVKASYSINPLVGYFVTDKVAVGVLGGFSKADTANKATSVGVFGRCHFMDLGKKCHVFSQVDVSSNKSTVASVETKSTTANLGLGANCTLTKKLDLTMHVANLVSYQSANEVSILTVGFNGIANPYATAGFGLIYKF